jgi:hypothetical protein
MTSTTRILSTTAICACVLAASSSALAQTQTVWTQHMDNWRTGWNYNETILTPANVASSQFGLIASVPLPNMGDAQPLIVPNQQITCPTNAATYDITCQAGLSGVYQVVYVITNPGVLYAINAANGAILLQRDFNKPTAGGGARTATPVIDTTRNTIDVVIRSGRNSAGNYRFSLNEVNLVNFTDYTTPYPITGANTNYPLTNGVIYDFNPNIVTQKPALLLANDNIYVGFEAFGEFSPSLRAISRGWMLAYSAQNLAPMATPLLTDQLATSENDFFVGAIWMSGTGPAADAAAGGSNIYFATSNSDSSGTSYNPPYNIEESVVQVTADLNISTLFTPYDYATLDANDWEIGSGGVMAIPTNWSWYSAPNPQLVVAAGKDGRMFLLNANNMGGYTPGGPDNVLDVQQIGGCWCAPSFFTGSDGVGRVVSSGGNTLSTWKIVQTATSSSLVQEASITLPFLLREKKGANFPSGFFTSVSSNGTSMNNGIIWVTGRQAASRTTVTLYALNATPSNGTFQILNQVAAGPWNYPLNANTVPVVANGQVYVASDGYLTIWGLTSSGASATHSSSKAAKPAHNH